MNKEKAKQIVKNEFQFNVTNVDGFTIVRGFVETKNRTYKSTGLSRCSEGDEFRAVVGIKRAEGNAKQAMIKALMNKPCNHSYQSYSIVRKEN